MTWDRKRAFTLIELLVVIIILAVMSAIVVPAYARYLEKARFDSETHELQDIFAYAREKAVSADMTVTLHFDRGSDTFLAAADPMPPESDEPTVFQNASYGDASSGQEIHQIYKVGESYRIENYSVLGTGSDGSDGQAQGSSDIQFRGDGTSDGAELSLVSREGYTAHMTLWPATGRLTMQQDTGQNP